MINAFRDKCFYHMGPNYFKGIYIPLAMKNKMEYQDLKIYQIYLTNQMIRDKGLKSLTWRIRGDSQLAI